MKEVSLTSGLGLLLILPITYLLLKLGVDIVIVFIVNVIPWLLETLFDLYYENKFIGFPVWGFYRRVYGIVFPLAIIVFMIPYVVHIFLPFQGWGRFMIVCFVSVVTSVIVIYYLGLSKYLRGVVLDKVNSFIKTRLKRS